MLCWWVKGVNAQDDRQSEHMVYRGHRDCYCLLVIAVVVAVMWGVHHVMRVLPWITPPVLVRQVAVFGRSQLNGVHGEATNSDDVERWELYEMVGLELDELGPHFGQYPRLSVVLDPGDELKNFAILCGQLMNLVHGVVTVSTLLQSLELVKLCIAEESAGSLDYTEILYDLFVYRNQAMKRLRHELGTEVFSFLMYDVEQAVVCLGRSPRESQLRSSHGEITEGDDYALGLQESGGASPRFSQLGSSHGEVTESDDMGRNKKSKSSPEHNAHEARKRLQKESHARQHHQEQGRDGAHTSVKYDVIRGGGPEPNFPDGMVIEDIFPETLSDFSEQCDTPEARAKIAQREHQGRQEKVHRRTITKQISWEDYPKSEETIKRMKAMGCDPFYFDGQTYSSNMGVRATVIEGTVVCAEMGYGYVKVRQIKEGKDPWIDDPDDNTAQVVVPLVGLYDLPGYRRHVLDESRPGHVDIGQVMTFPPVSNLVLLPLFQRLQKLPSCDIDGMLVKALLCSVDRVSNLEIPSALITSTLRHKQSQTHCRFVVSNNKEDMIRKTKYGGEIGYGNAIGIDRLLELASVEKYCFVHINHRKPVGKPSYPVRKDFKVYKKGGVEGDRAGFEFLDEDGRVVFEPVEENQKKQYSTRLYGFHGKNQKVGGFYANTAESFNHGLQRILGAREDEDRKRSKAKDLGKNIMAMKGVVVPERVPDELAGVNPFFAGREMCPDVREQHLGGPLWTSWSTEQKRQIEKGFAAMTRNDHRMRLCHPDAYPPTDQPETSKFIAAKAHKLALSCGRWKVREALDGLQSGTRWAYYKIFDTFLDVWHSMATRQAIANLPHAKKALRVAYYKGQRLGDPDDVMIDRMKAAVKNELSKFGKNPRLYQQMGRGCLYAPELVEYAKVLIDGVHVETHKGVTMVVMVLGKRKDGDVEKLFNDLYSALDIPNFVMAGVYSDDMVIGGNLHTPHGVEQFLFNVDVASNDSSQDLPSFLTTYMILNLINSDRALGLIEQCMKPVELINPDDKTQSVMVKFDGPFEGSGSTLTTLLNHVGSYLILMGVLWWMGEAVSGALRADVNVAECIRLGAEEVGHSVTVEDCKVGGEIVFEKLTLLHLHPARVTFRPERCCRGKNSNLWIPRIGIECILRKFGWVDGSLTHITLGMADNKASVAKFGAMSQQQQADAFGGAVVRGWKNEARDPILAALRSRFTEDDLGVVQAVTSKDASRFEVRDDLNYSQVEISADTLRNRYDITDAEVEEIASGIKNMHVGSFVVTSGVAKILGVGYGIAEIPDEDCAIENWSNIVEVGP